MRILHVNLASTASPVDGIGVVIAVLGAAQRAGGHTVGYLDPAWRGGRSGLTTATRAVAVIVRSRPDIVHLHSVYRPLHAFVVAACVVAGIPYVLSPHSGLAPAGRSRRRRTKAAWIAVAEKPMLRRAARVACLSDIEEDDVRELVARARTCVIPNPVVLPASSPHPAGRSRGTGPRAVTLSRFDVYQKGLDRLVELARALPHVAFDVYGELDHNDRDAARTLIATAPRNVRFHAPVLGDDKLAVLHDADVYVQLSRWEGQSIAVLEAMAAATPCIVSHYVAQTLGPDGADCVVGLPESTDAAAAAVRAVLADGLFRERLAGAAAQWARSATNPASVAHRFDAIYAGAISAAGPRTRRSPRLDAGQVRGAES